MVVYRSEIKELAAKEKKKKGRGSKSNPKGTMKTIPAAAKNASKAQV